MRDRLKEHEQVNMKKGKLCLETENGTYAVLRLVAQTCLTLCDPLGCSLPASSVHRILQARILKWVAMPSSRGSSKPRD